MSSMSIGQLARSAGVATDTVDPEFGLDTGFYLFAMPFYSAVLGFVSAAIQSAYKIRYANRPEHQLDIGEMEG